MKSSKKKTSTERKRHPAKRRQVSASAPNPSSRRGEKKAAKVVAKPAKKPAKKAAPKKVAKVKPAKKTPAKKVAKKAKYRAPATPRQVAPKAKPAYRAIATPRHTERKRHPAKPVKKVAPKKPSKTKKAVNTERKRHPAKATPKPAKKVVKKVSKKPTKRGLRPLKRGTTTKPRPKSLPLKKGGKTAKPAKVPVKKARGRPKGTSKDSASAPSLSPALPHRGGRYAPNPSSRRGEKKTAKVVATPVRPQKRETGALIVSKRGRKSKKEREAAAEAQSIFVPRDVKAENTEENQTHDARAYSPDELEQLLMARGVSNMNVFDPKTAITAKVEKKKTQKKIILTTLPKAKKKKTVGPVSVSDLFGFNPFAKNSTSQEEKLIPEKWRKYYRKLMDRKEALLARLNDHSEKAFQKEGKEETGDVSAYSQHTADIDNDAFDRDLALSRLPAEQEELSEINIAIERMKKGTYGICEITGKPIPAERLNKVPFTRYSLEGKLEAEKQRDLAARRRRANATGDISEVIDLENDAPVQLPEEENEEPQ